MKSIPHNLNADSFVIPAGPFAAWTLAAKRDSAGATWVLARAPGDPAWCALPLRRLAAAYAVGEGPWPWLRAKGIWRPSPRGKAPPSVPRGRRKKRGIELLLSNETHEQLQALAELGRKTRSQVVKELVETAMRQAAGQHT